MKKRILSLTLIISLLAGLIPTFAVTASAANEGIYTYTVSNGEATITECDPSVSGAIEVPSTLGGYPVTSIGNFAFSDCYSLASVTIGDSVTSIGDYAFVGCDSLTSITIPDSVTSIGDYAFSDCYSLASVTIGDSVTSIGDHAFDGCSSLTSITIPDSVTTIGYYAFHSCDSLASITIPDSVTSIGGSAFCDCSNLTSITIPDSVTSIGGSAFCGCSSLASIRIPDSVTSIGQAAFSDCSSLAGITIPDSVTSIENFAFYDCSNLTSITIPDSVTSIGQAAFCGCSNLTSITIPDSVTSIGYYAFSDCSSLAGITIPDSVTSIENFAFSYCYSLVSIEIGDGVTSIGDHAFRACDSLASVTIPDSVTSIGDYAFDDCYSLTSITIPDSVIYIGDYAFDGCCRLTDVYYAGSQEKWWRIGGRFFGGEATIHYNYIPQKITTAYEPTSSVIINDGKLTEVSADSVTKSYPKYTTVRPKTINNSANLVGDWKVKNTTVETGEINSGVTISLSGDLIVENGVFKVTKGTTMNVASLKVGTNGKVIVDGELNVNGEISLSGGSGKTPGGYLELSRRTSLFNVAVAKCNKLNISGYGYITVNGRFDVNGDMNISTKSTASNYTNNGSIWLRGNLTQKKGGLFAPGNTFCPKEKFKLILNRNVSSAVHKLNFASPKKSYINDLYIVKGSYDNFHDGNAKINGVVKKIIEANNDKGYVFESETAEFKKKQNEWKTAFNELFNTISSKTAGYVDLATNQSYFKQLFGEDTYKALRTYFGVLCLSMQIDPPSSFGYIGIKDSIPHYVDFYNSATNKWVVNGKFIIDAIDIAEISGTRTISYKCPDGETRQFCVLMYGNIEPLGNQLMELVSSNWAEYYTGILGTTLNAFNKEPQKYIAKLLWEGVAHTKIPGLKDVTKNTLQNFISSQSFQSFVAKTCNYNSSGTSLLSIDDKQESLSISLFSDIQTGNEVLFTSQSVESSIFADASFEAEIRKALGISADKEITEDMLKDLTDLIMPEKNITSIKGIEYMTSLEKLDLSGNAITDISYLAGLASLTELNLSGNNIYDISAVEKLLSLEKLIVNSNYISDITPVEGLAALEVLDVGNNSINDLSPIGNLVNIKQLNVAYNSVSSLDALCKMTSLKVLYAQNNLISDISVVSSCPLAYVNLSDNSITDISALEGSGVAELNLSNNPVSDISALSYNPNLTTLIVEGTAVDDEAEAVFETLTEIKKLSVQNTAISEVSAFSTLTSLEELSVANTYVTDLSPLYGTYQLRVLDISDNNISDLSFISSLTNIRELYADNCGLITGDAEMLSNAQCLEILSLSSNYISDIDFLNSLTELTYLDLSNNENISEESVEEKRMQFESAGYTFIYTLSNIAVTDIFMDSTEKTIESGTVIKDFAYVYPYNATDENVIYTSTDDNVVTYQNNILTAIRKGSAIVTAQNADGSISSSCNITVEARPKKATIKSAEITDNTMFVEISSLSDENVENASIILTLYDSDNKIIKAKELRMDVTARSNLVYKMEDVQVEDRCAYYKVFVWDSALCPLSDPFESELPNS